jgi:glycosyltransferase involved in cell wall biosynthesis
MSLKFSVVIPTHHRPKELMRCLMGVLAQEIPKDLYEIIVVDNDVDGSAEKTVWQADPDKIKIRYERKSNNNVSEARNLGSKLAQGEWIAFLNDDCVPKPDWLASAITLLQKINEPGLIFGGGYFVESEAQMDCSPEAIYLPKDKYLIEGNCFFRRSEYLAEGGMRPDLGPSQKRFGYHEGSELQNRFIKIYGSGHKRVLFNPLAVHHLESKKPRSWSAFISGYDSAFAFGSSEPKKSIFNFVRILGCIGRYSVRAIKQNSSGKERELYRAGELVGELMLQGKSLYRQCSVNLRLKNNKILTVYQKKASEREPATSEDIRQWLTGKKPFLAGKIGGAELLAMEYLDHRIKFELPKAWSWRRPATRLYNNAGFFPIQKKYFTNWNKEMRHAVTDTDFLCVWQADPFLKAYENALIACLAPKSFSIPMSVLGRDILPKIASFRWLVVSPFVKTMQKQLPRMKKVNDPNGKLEIDWNHLEKTCQFVRCPFQSHLEPSPYVSWEDGLEKLTKEVSLKDFDLALIGAGAWSLPLGSRIKRMGKGAIHMGGEMQLLFGIKGKRWANTELYNSSWVTAEPDERPKNRNRIEDGCYW